MTATPRVALGAATLVKDWYIDIDSGYPGGASTWVPISGVQSFKAGLDAVTKDVTTFDGGGAKAEQKTADQWSIELKLKRAARAAAATQYDAGAELLRAASLLYGAQNLVQIRWYEVNGAGAPVTEAWQGIACVAWEEANDGYDDPRAITVKLTGHGARTAVSPNPGSV